MRLVRRVLVCLLVLVVLGETSGVARAIGAERRPCTAAAARTPSARPCPCPDCPVTLRRARAARHRRCAAHRRHATAAAATPAIPACSPCARSRPLAPRRRCAAIRVASLYVAVTSPLPHARRRHRPPASLIRSASRPRSVNTEPPNSPQGVGMRAFAFVLSLALVAGCNDNTDKQNHAIGSPCTTSGQCGTGKFFCDLDHPNGYCKADCHKDADCPTGSVCAGAGMVSPGECHKRARTARRLPHRRGLHLQDDAGRRVGAILRRARARGRRRCVSASLPQRWCSLRRRR